MNNIIKIFFLFSFFIVSCSVNENSVFHEIKHVSTYENGGPKETHFIIDSLKDSVVIKTYFENGEINAQYTEVNKLKNGEYKLYFTNGKLKESRNYKKDFLHGDYEVYNNDGSISIKYVFFGGACCYKKKHEYKNGKLVSYDEDISLMIDKNKNKFIVNEESIIYFKLPIEVDGFTYAKFSLNVQEYAEQKFPPIYPDSFPVTNDSFMSLIYNFDEPCKLVLLGTLYQKKDGVVKELGDIGQYFEVVNSTEVEL